MTTRHGRDGWRPATESPNPPTGSRGADLGLSIVRSVSTAHSGHTRPVARRDGGLTVTVELVTSQ
jgi:signal transduction histidine kinase